MLFIDLSLQGHTHKEKLQWIILHVIELIPGLQPRGFPQLLSMIIASVPTVSMYAFLLTPSSEFSTPRRWVDNLDVKRRGKHPCTSRFS